MTRDERQEICVTNWVKSKCRSTIVGPTGIGKSIIGIKCIKKVLNKYPYIKVLIVVPTVVLKDQWQNLIDKYELSFNCEVMVINTAIKQGYSCNILVVDEIHVTGAPLLQKLFIQIKYKHVLGLTATFERLDGKDELIARYAPVCDIITVTEARINGWISDYQEYLVILHVDNINEYEQLNKEFYKLFEFFHFDFQLAMSMLGKNGLRNRLRLRDIISKGLPDSKRKGILKDITYHAVSLMRIIQKRKKFINEHPKKIEITQKIINARSDSKIITFSNNIKIAESIGIGSVYTGKDSKNKARITLDEFKDMKSGVINTVKMADLGMDVPDINVVIMLGLDSSKTRRTQRIGRGIRKQEGKITEIFTLVIADTVECTWEKKSRIGSDIMVIGEDGLDDILNGNDPRPYLRKVKDYTYRF